MIQTKKVFLGILAAQAFLFSPSSVFAQEPAGQPGQEAGAGAQVERGVRPILETGSGSAADADAAGDAPQNMVRSSSSEPPKFDHYYDELTLDKLSKVYWRLNILNINDDASVDNFLMINECDIYKEYRYNEFEWGGVRERGRQYIQDNMKTFPDRFLFEQPLFLGEYDINRQVFKVQEAYQVKGTQKFEVATNDYKSYCGSDPGTGIPGYPTNLLIEMNQPVNLVEIPVEKQIAKIYIEDVTSQIHKLPEKDRIPAYTDVFRTAYIVYKIRLFSFKGLVYLSAGISTTSAHIYAILEGYEIYADKEHEKLLYFQNFLREQKDEDVDSRLKNQFEELKKKRAQ